jgi:hypothetical protein
MSCKDHRRTARLSDKDRPHSVSPKIEIHLCATELLALPFEGERSTLRQFDASCVLPSIRSITPLDEIGQISHFRGIGMRHDGWLRNLLFGFAGNALWTGIYSGFLVTGVTTAIAYFTKSAFWVDKGLTALITCVAIAILVALVSFIQRRVMVSPQQQAPSNPTATRNVEDFLRTFDNALISEAERLIRQDSDHYPQGEARDRYLIRSLAATYIIGLFETTYANIYGSQLKALDDLNVRAMTVEQLRPYYDRGLPSLPENIRAQSSFERWLAYMREMVLIAQQGDNVTITLRGGEFLRYILARRYTRERAG